MSTSDNNHVQSEGAGTLGLLGVVFVVLKLTGVIDWSWWWVTLPFWGGIVLVLFVIAGIFLTLGVAVLLDKITDRKGK